MMCEVEQVVSSRVCKCLQKNNDAEGEGERKTTTAGRKGSRRDRAR